MESLVPAETHESASEVRNVLETPPTYSPPNPTRIPTILLVGTTGAGKSSVINMLPNDPQCVDDIAQSSLSSRGVTDRSDAYHKIIANQLYRVFDSAGLGEGPTGTVPTDLAVKMLYDVLISEPVINLIVVVIRSGRLDGMAENNLLLMRLLAGDEIPIVIVFTHVDQLKKDADHVNWWNEQPESIRKRFPCLAHTCLSANKGRYKEEWRHDLYDTTRDNLLKLITENASHPGFKVKARADGRTDDFFNKLRELLGKPSWSDVKFCDELRQVLLSYGIAGNHAKNFALQLANQRTNQALSLPQIQRRLNRSSRALDNFTFSLLLPKFPAPGILTVDETAPPTILIITANGTITPIIMKMLATPHTLGLPDDVPETFEATWSVIDDRAFRVVCAPAPVSVSDSELLDGAAPPDVAIKRLYIFLTSQPRINLAIFAMPAGRLTAHEERNYSLIRYLIGNKVPLALLVTGVRPQDMADYRPETPSSQDTNGNASSTSGTDNNTEPPAAAETSPGHEGPASEPEPDVNGWWSQQGRVADFKFAKETCLLAYDMDSAESYTQGGQRIRQLIMDASKPLGYRFPPKSSFQFVLRSRERRGRRGLSDLKGMVYDLLLQYGIDEQESVRMALTMGWCGHDFEDEVSSLGRVVLGLHILFIYGVVMAVALFIALLLAAVALSIVLALASVAFALFVAVFLPIILIYNLVTFVVSKIRSWRKPPIQLDSAV